MRFVEVGEETFGRALMAESPVCFKEQGNFVNAINFTHTVVARISILTGKLYISSNTLDKLQERSRDAETERD